MAVIFAPTSDGVSEQEKEHGMLACRVAAEGMVVLENNGILPLKEKRSLALFGLGARHTIKGGTGSGDVNSRSVVTIEDALRDSGFTLYGEAWRNRLDERIAREHAAYNAKVQALVKEKGMGALLDVLSHPFLSPTSVEILPDELGLCDTALYVISRNSGEGADRHPVKGEYYLSDEEASVLDLITAHYAHTIVILNVGSVIDTSLLKGNPKIDAILLMSQAGNNSGIALVNALTGKIEPSGRLTTTWAKDYWDYPSAHSFSHCNGDTDDEYYSEGIYVGYRYFDSFNVTPAYPFGYGLGYTIFSVTNAQVTADEKTVQVKALVTNTGAHAGRHVVQVYVSAPEGRIEKPYQELRGYVKTQLLNPGESTEIVISFSVVDLASYDTDRAAYILEAGDYIVRVGSHSRATRVAAILRLDTDAVTVQVRHLLQQDLSIHEISAKSVPSYSYAAEAEEIAAAPVLNICASKIACKTLSYHKELELLPPKKTLNPITLADVEAGTYTEEDLVSQLSVEEMAALCVGASRGGLGSQSIIGAASSVCPGAAGDTSSILLDSRGVRNLTLADGPAGLRLNTVFLTDQQNNLLPISLTSPLPGFEFLTAGKAPDIPENAVYHYQYTTAIPIATLLAQTWDESAITAIGEIIGAEMDFFGADLWLAPGMNIHRNPLCGRNFEYYSEDPLLSGRCAAADTMGVQKHHGGTTIKHFAFNNQEDNRMHVNAHVSERTAREIYLKGFEIAVKTAKPKAIMSSYNLINGIHTANSEDLLTGYARDEWGFDGIIMTDWGTTGNMLGIESKEKHKYGCSEPALCIFAGNDLIMPGSQKDVDRIIAAVNEGSLSLGRLQACAMRMIHAVRTCKYDQTMTY